MELFLKVVTVFKMVNLGGFPNCIPQNKDMRGNGVSISTLKTRDRAPRPYLLPITLSTVAFLTFDFGRGYCGVHKHVNKAKLLGREEKWKEAQVQGARGVLSLHHRHTPRNPHLPSESLVCQVILQMYQSR